VNTPVGISRGDIPASATISSMSVGGNHTCVLTNGNTGYCWGAGFSGRLGNGDINDSNVPVAVSQGSITFSKLWVSGGVSCATTPAGLAYCWGVNGDNQIGGGSAYDTYAYINAPLAVSNGVKPSGAKFTDIKTGSIHTCGLASNMKIYCWGSATNGLLGNGQTSGKSSVPVATTEVF